VREVFARQDKEIGVSDTSQGPGWWQASDGKYYPPEQAPGYQQPGASPACGVPGSGNTDIGSTLTYAWNKFIQNIGEWIVLWLILVAVTISEVVPALLDRGVSAREAGLDNDRSQPVQEDRPPAGPGGLRLG